MPPPMQVFSNHPLPDLEPSPILTDFVPVLPDAVASNVKPHVNGISGEDELTLEDFYDADFELVRWTPEVISLVSATSLATSQWLACRC